ncbi:tetratricopeptide repeat protein [Streptomyces sp. NPDC001100]
MEPCRQRTCRRLAATAPVPSAPGPLRRRRQGRAPGPRRLGRLHAGQPARGGCRRPGGRWLGDPERTVAAFERALALDPANWSLHLDLADVHAEQGDFAAAVRLIDRGMEHESTELTLCAAGAAYRARLTGSPAELSELIELAPNLPNNSYRDLLIHHACAGPALPAELVAAARRIQNGSKITDGPGLGD